MEKNRWRDQAEVVISKILNVEEIFLLCLVVFPLRVLDPMIPRYDGVVWWES
jgi:hypothetical protein